ncbi:transcription elongation factor SPT4 [Aphelenchoides avenae]|nr:transcription elongation factor SPT4 [Aphelenchus avenae]
MSIETIPRDLKGLRACLYCSLIKSVDQFELDGCDNCERFLQLKGDMEKVYECTSANFDGMIAGCEPSDSWVCRWQKTNSKCRGVYAVSVSGSLPKHVISDLKAMGVRYHPNMRDKTTK